MQMLQSINLALRFILELCALLAVGYWGFKTGSGFVMKMGLGIGVPLFMAVIWGTFGAPKAAVQLSAGLHLFLELIIFGLPVVAMLAAENPRLAWAYAVIAVINRVLMYVWRQ
jgi:hypothetical protein